MKVILLNHSIYNTKLMTDIKYPVEVEANMSKSFLHIAEVPGSEMARITGCSAFEEVGHIGFYNSNIYDDRIKDSWVAASDHPFMKWNRLKESRAAGSMPSW